MDVYEKIITTPNDNETFQPDEVIALDHLQREKGRFKITAQSGNEVRVFLERGNTLKRGQLLKSQCGKVIQVDYAAEPVMRATAKNWPDFVRACYHLGNRHVRLEIGERSLQILPDHVLAELVESFGLEVKECKAVFIPEPGAYAKQSASAKHATSEKTAAHTHHHHH